MSWLKRRAEEAAKVACWGPAQAADCYCSYDETPCAACVRDQIEAVAREFADRVRSRFNIQTDLEEGVIFDTGAIIAEADKDDI